MKVAVELFLFDLQSFLFCDVCAGMNEEHLAEQNGGGEQGRAEANAEDAVEQEAADEAANDVRPRVPDEKFQQNKKQAGKTR